MARMASIYREGAQASLRSWVWRVWSPLAATVTTKLLSTGSSFCRGSRFCLHNIPTPEERMGSHPALRRHLHQQNAFFPMSCARLREKETQATEGGECLRTNASSLPCLWGRAWISFLSYLRPAPFRPRTYSYTEIRQSCSVRQASSTRKPSSQPNDVSLAIIY